jgi:glutamate synthase domain-containing protein 1
MNKTEGDGQRRYHKMPPPKQGLYDPRFEHDACGVGFVADIKGRKSHDIIRDGLTVLHNVTHRGARGAEANTGDGAGMMIQVPHKFLQKIANIKGFNLPAPGQYGVGMVFLPRNEIHRRAIRLHFEKIIEAEGQRVIGWRTVPTKNFALGQSAIASEPKMRLILIERSPDISDDMAFERKLYIIRKRAEHEIRYGGRFEGGESFYIPSLSYKTLIYKGMLVSDQVEGYFPDLSDPDMESAIALVHSRFSTNTFPSWERAHPYRYVIHNGEINTLRGNVNWFRAQENMFESELFEADIKKLLPIIGQDGSDTAMFDNVLEFLVMAGRSLPHAMLMMIPEPWSHHETMPDDKRAFYEYHANLMEPWDGPAAMGFSDGFVVGALLDRNGLRPARYYVTTDDKIVLSSEVGVLDIPTENVAYKGRLEPGKMLLVDTRQGRIISDDELKRQVAHTYPYRDWLDKYQVRTLGPAARPRRMADRRRPPEHLPAPANFRLQRGRPAGCADPDGAKCHRSGRLDGQRRGPGSLVRQAQTALQLFQAVVRAGDQPAHRRPARGNCGLHRGHGRRGDQFAQTDSAKLPPDSAGLPDSDQRGNGPDSPLEDSRLYERQPADFVPGRVGRRWAGARDG